MTQSKNDNRIDTTIADIHKTRERISDAFGGDISAITEDAKKRQEQSGRKTVSFAETSNGVVNPTEKIPAS
jgi:hypothetical protein